MVENFYQKILRLLTRERPLLFLFALTFTAVGIQMACTTPQHSFHSQAQHSKPAKQFQVVYSPQFFQDWRDRFLSLHKDCDKSGLVRGIFLGDDSFISDNTKNVFHRAGLMHLLAASGFNCWLVAFFFLVITKFTLYMLAHRLPSVLFLQLRVWAPSTCSLVGAWLFWLWSDQSPPITRSVILMSAKFVFWFFCWRVPFARLLLVQYLISLCFVPRLWKSASFQLTFGCLFGLVYFPKLVQYLRKRFFPLIGVRFFKTNPRCGSIAHWLWIYVLTNLGACFGTIPTTYIVFEEINFTSILTNWFSTPYASAILMPLAFTTMLVLVVPGAEHWSGLHSLAVLNSKSAEWFEIFLRKMMQVLPSLLFTP